MIAYDNGTWGYGVMHNEPDPQPSVTCARCGATCTPSGIATGYALTPNGKKICYTCCAEQDSAHMIDTGKAVLYFDETARTVSNWPGSLKFTVVAMWHGRHNIAGKVTFVRFYGPDDAIWTGRQMGDWNQLCYCKRTKLIDISA